MKQYKPLLAILGLDGLAKMLADAGYDVVQGSPVEVATATRGSQRPVVPILSHSAGSSAVVWGKAQIAIGRTVVWLRAADDSPAPSGAVEIALPATAADVLNAAGLEVTNPLLFSTPVTEDIHGAPLAEEGGTQPTTEPPSPASGGERKLGVWAQAMSITALAAPVQPEPGPEDGADWWDDVSLPEVAERPREHEREPVDLSSDLWEDQLTPVSNNEAWWLQEPEETVAPPTETSPYAVGGDIDDLWASGPRRRHRAGAAAPVVVVVGAKGGVGTTSIALSLGELAASQDRFERAAVVDATRRDDLREMLALRNGELPTAYDASFQSSPRAAVAAPAVIGAARQPGMPVPHFAAVLGGVHNTTSAIEDVVSYLHLEADLIIVDAGSLPLTLDIDASLLLFVCDDSKPAVERLLSSWKNSATPQGRKALVLFNRLLDRPTLDLSLFEQTAMSSFGARVVGKVSESPYVREAVAASGWCADGQFGQVLKAILTEVT